MPKLGTSATVSTTKEVKLAPQIRKRLLTAFRTYAGLSDQRKAINSAMDKQKGIIADLREDTGEASLSLDGFTTTLVAPLRKKFNKKKFVAEGGDLAIYELAMEDVPVKPYERVSCPGAAVEEEE